MGRGRRGVSVAACAALLALAVAATASASETGNSIVTDTTQSNADVDLIGQTFTVPAEPVTDDFLHTLRISNVTLATGSFRVYVTELDGSELPTGAPLFTSDPISAPLNSTPVTVYPNIAVTPGQRYGFYLDSPSGMGLRGANTNPYPGGNLIFHQVSTNAWVAAAAFDLAFLAQFSADQGATQTAVSCPGSGQIGVESSCTVTVTNLGAGLGTPTGTVDLSSSGGTGAFTPCTLDGAGQCSVTYTPTSGSSHQISAAFQGDSTHLPSSGSTFMNVGRRTTSMQAGGCTPAQVTVGQTVTCSAVVTDTGPAPLSAPAGSIAWASTLAGSFTPSQLCTVSPTGVPGQSACQATFTPTAPGRHRFLAGYGGDAEHEPSSLSNAGEVTVIAAPGPNCAPLRKKLKSLKRKLRRVEGKAERRTKKKIKRTRDRLRALGC